MSKGISEALAVGDVATVLEINRALYGDTRMSVAPVAPGGDLAPFAVQADAAAEEPAEDDQKDEEQKTYDKEYVDKLTKEAKSWREKFQAEKAARADAEKSSGKAATLEDRVAKAEQRAAEADARALRREIAMDHGLSKDDAVTMENISDEETLVAVASRFAYYRKALAEKTSAGEETTTRTVGVKGSTNGRRSAPAASSDEALGRMLFGS